MANVGADVRRAAEADLRVHVRAVHIDLAAAVVDNFANLDDALLEDAVGGGIGDHERGQIAGVRLGLGAQVRQVNVAAARRRRRGRFSSRPWPRWPGWCRGRRRE